jgi:cytochrome c553
MKHAQLLFLVGLLSINVGAFANDGGKAKAMPCTACHGPDGNSTLNPEWPNLAGQHESYIVAQLHAFKSGARKNPNMSGMVATLSNEDMPEIAAFFSSQPVKIQSVDAASVAAGAALYRGGNKATGVPACMACHGPNGAGNPAAVFPALRGQHAKYTINQLRAYRNGERTNDPKEIMQTIAGRMSTTEIDNVAKFIEGLH